MTSYAFSIVHNADLGMMTSSQDSVSQIMRRTIHFKHIYHRAKFENFSLSNLRYTKEA